MFELVCKTREVQEEEEVWTFLKEGELKMTARNSRLRTSVTVGRTK